MILKIPGGDAKLTPTREVVLTILWQSRNETSCTLLSLLSCTPCTHATTSTHTPLRTVQTALLEAPRIPLGLCPRLIHELGNVPHPDGNHEMQLLERLLPTRVERAEATLWQHPEGGASERHSNRSGRPSLQTRSAAGAVARSRP